MTAFRGGIIIGRHRANSRCFVVFCSARRPTGFIADRLSGRDGLWDKLARNSEINNRFSRHYGDLPLAGASAAFCLCESDKGFGVHDI